MTETYRASRAGGSAVALKLLRPDRGGRDANVRAAFLATARRNKSVRLAGVAKILEINEGPDVFVVSELLDGANLDSLFESATATGSMDPALVGQLGIQIARILTRMHERREPVLHGCLSPGNVVVTSGGRVTLLDPGFTAALRPIAHLPVDKLWYAAPEIALEHQPPSVASDLYGLGAVLYYLLTGEPPVMGESPEELEELFADGPAELPGVPDWLGEAVATLLSRHPEDRPRSAAAAALSLSPFPDGATRLGAIVNGSVDVAPPPAVLGHGGGRGTMVISRSDETPSPVPPTASKGGTQPGIAADASDEFANPFDNPASDPSIRPALEDMPPVGRPPSAKPTAPAKPPAFSAPLTLTPLRQSPAPASAGDLIAGPLVGPPSIGLASEPAWAAEPAPSGLSLSNEPQWADLEAVGVVSAPVAKMGPALENEPQWVDAASSVMAASRGVSLGVDDFLDLGAAPGSGIKLAGVGAAAQSSRVDLPELIADDLSVAPTASPALQTIERAPQGMVTFGSGPQSAPAAIGAIAFGEDEDEEKAALGAQAAEGHIVLPQVPRRAGSARLGAQPVKKTSPAVAAGMLLLMCVGGVGLWKMFDEPVRVLPSPQDLAKQHGEADPTEAKPVAKSADDVAAPARGQLTVNTTPQGATVWIDGKERGKTPLTAQTTPGTHRLVIVKPGFKMLREVTDTAEGLTIKRTLPPANINFGGTVVLNVQCKTPGKYPVFVDGKDTGLLCPIDSLKIPAGNRLIGVYVIPDNKVWSFEREVVAGPKPHRVVFSY